MNTQKIRMYLKNQRVPLNDKPIALDMKHIGPRKLGTDEQKQARVYKQLIDEGKIERIEYVFSLKEAAEKNKKLLQGILKKKVRIYFIDIKGKMKYLK